VIVDDGVATAKAACLVVRARGARRGVLAVSIGPDDIVARFADYADEVVCLQTPAAFFAVGQGYRNFTQISDDEVIAMLDWARGGFREPVVSGRAGDPLLRDEEVRVTAGSVSLAGISASRSTRSGSRSSPTAAAAAATAHATATWPRC